MALILYLEISEPTVVAVAHIIMTARARMVGQEAAEIPLALTAALDTQRLYVAEDEVLPVKDFQVVAAQVLL
jgi:hypothetical protein